MNTTEGLLRIAAVIRWTGYLFAASMLVLGYFVNTEMELRPFLMMLGIAGFFAAVGWFLAWIIEGFAKPKS